MQLDFFGTLLISLALTLCFELAFCLAFKIRGFHDLILVVLVNTLTNPPVVLIHDILIRKTDLSPTTIMLALEITAIVIESICYKYCAKNIKHPFLISLGANAFSYFAGLSLLTIFRRVSYGKPFC